MSYKKKKIRKIESFVVAFKIYKYFIWPIPKAYFLKNNIQLDV